MKTIDLYTKDEIDILKSYYSDIVVNKIFRTFTSLKITDLASDKINEKYRLVCVGHLLKQPNIVIKIDISTLCKGNSLLSPSEVLKTKH
ncbi:hypothetical protein [Arenibacter lacus]|uniref:hypothetical protein n=1 Tax=Arenibacter lacus TaxID=2608629 RepID=UPI00123D9E17|nr:hypothetical protein [Arenibacter lacus]